MRTTTISRWLSPMVLWAVLAFGGPCLVQTTVGQTAATSSEQADEALGTDQKADPDAERSLTEPWETFKPAGGDVSFEMPKPPKFKQRSFTPVTSQPAIKVNLHSAVIADGAMMFVAGWHDLHTIPRTNRQRKAILAGAISGSIANVRGTLGSTENVTLDRNPGRRYTYRFSGGSVIYKVVEEVYLVGARQYQFRLLAQLDRFDETAANRFIKSVKLLDPDNDLPPRPRNRPGQG